MEAPTREEILKLIEADPKIAVSIYMPRFADSGPQARQDQIRLKNLLDVAEDELRTLEIRLSVAEEILQPLRDELDNSFFWKESGSGLAAFLSPGFKRVYRLDQDLPERSLVDTQFCIRPLVPALSHSGRYYVLDLSENHNRLVLVEGGKTAEVELSAPASLNDSMHLQDREQGLQMHSTASPQSGMAAGMFHGGGSWHDYEKQEIPLYCKRINDALVKMLSEDKAPLLLAADERLYSFYREANTYPYLVDKPLLGNYHEFTPQKLASEAWPKVEPFVVKGAREKRARMDEVKNTEKGPVRPIDVIEAAVNGQIDTLFIDSEAQVWGSYDPSTHEVALHKQRQAGSVELIELAVRETLRSGGLVLSLATADMPVFTPMAALLRWSGEPATGRP